MTAYEVRPIADLEIDGSFVLAKLSLPGLDLGAWRKLSEQLRDDGRSEISITANRAGYLQGLAISRAGIGRVLEVSSFVVVSAADAPGVGMDLFAYLHARAKALGCASLRIRIAGRDEVQIDVDGDDSAIEALLALPPAGS